MFDCLCQNGAFQIKIYIVFSTLLAQKKILMKPNYLWSYREFVESVITFLNNESD